MSFFIGWLLLLGVSTISAWDYSDPDTDWPQDYPMCGGESQSPINIDSDNATGMDYSSFSFSLGYKFVQKGPLENDGHTLKYTADESKGASISGGPLNGSYTLNQFHLHWGSKPGQGSEHTVNGKSYDGELHLVHYKSTFDNISAAVASNESDALSVVGILIQEASTWDQHAAGKPSQTEEMLRKGAIELSRAWRGPGAPSIDLEVIPDHFISEITDIMSFYHYTGSLTTPACAQIVQWIVLDKPFYVHKNFLGALRKNVDMDGNTVEDNYRPTQELNSRTVYYHDAMAGEGEEDTCAGNRISDLVSQQHPVDGTELWAEDYCCGECYICGLWHDNLGSETYAYLDYFSSDNTWDLAGAERCQSLCEADDYCNTFSYQCIPDDYFGNNHPTDCECFKYDSDYTTWPDTWYYATTTDIWNGPKTGCPSSIPTVALA